MWRSSYCWVEVQTILIIIIIPCLIALHYGLWFSSLCVSRTCTIRTHRTYISVFSLSFFSTHKTTSQMNSSSKISRARWCWGKKLGEVSVRSEEDNDDWRENERKKRRKKYIKDVWEKNKELLDAFLSRDSFSLCLYNFFSLYVYFFARYLRMLFIFPDFSPGLLSPAGSHLCVLIVLCNAEIAFKIMRFSFCIKVFQPQQRDRLTRLFCHPLECDGWAERLWISSFKWCLDERTRDEDIKVFPWNEEQQQKLRKHLRKEGRSEQKINFLANRVEPLCVNLAIIWIDDDAEN